MRLVRPTSKVCDRARLCASLQLDGELSELERRLLAAHLAQCPPCRAFALDVGALTRMLRAARPEPISRPVAVSWRAGPRVASRALQVGTAALVLAAVGIGGLVGAGPGRDERRFAAPDPPANPLFTQSEPRAWYDLDDALPQEPMPMRVTVRSVEGSLLIAGASLVL